MKKSARKSPGSGHIRTRTLRSGEVRYDVLLRKGGKQITVAGGLRTRRDAEDALRAYQEGGETLTQRVQRCLDRANEHLRDSDKRLDALERKVSEIEREIWGTGGGDDSG